MENKDTMFFVSKIKIVCKIEEDNTILAFNITQIVCKQEETVEKS